MKFISDAIRGLSASLYSIVNKNSEPRLTEEIAWSLATYNLYATLDEQELDCFLLSLDKDEEENYYNAVFGQLTYPDSVDATWFTGEAEAVGVMEYLDHRIYFNEDEGEFCIDECDILEPEEVKIKDLEKSDAYLKTLFLDCDFANYMDVEGIEQTEVMARLKEPYRTWFKTEHHQYQADDT